MLVIVYIMYITDKSFPLVGSSNIALLESAQNAARRRNAESLPQNQMIPHSAPLRLAFTMRGFRRRRSAFTLVETALALGIVAFAMIPLLGLLPIGLQMSHNASDLTLSAQIAQRLAGMIQQAGYSSFQASSGTPGPADVYYYFDAEGQPLKSVNGAAPTSSVYTANIFLPTETDGNSGSNLQDGSVVDKSNVTMLRVQIVNDPAGRLRGTPLPTLAPDLKARAVTIPIYVANNGG